MYRVNGITSLGGDEGRVVCGCADHTVRVYDMNDGRCLHTLRGHTEWVNCVVAMGGGDVVVSGCRDGSMRVWDVRRGELLRTIDNAHSGSVV